MSDEQFLDDLRVRINDAHTGMPGAGSPPPDLWNRILSDHDEGRAKTMSTTTLSEPAMPQSWRSVNRQVSSSKTGGRRYALAAAVLVLALIGGVFVSNQRGPGGNDFDDLRYAALPVSPDASAVASGACQIDALSVEEVMAIVEDPYVNMDYERLNIAGFPGFLTNPNDILILQEGFGTALDGEDEEDARELTASYLACRSSGTLGQVFALMSPNKVQQTVFARFPAFRSEADVRSFLESSLSNPAQEVMFNPVFEEDAILIPATGPESALEHSFYPDYAVAYIGTQSTDASGNVLETSNARDVLQQTSEVGGPPQTLGAVSLIRYPDGDRWYVHDSEVVPVADNAKPAATQQAEAGGVQTGTAETEACVAEPMSAADLTRLLNDPDRYLDQEFGSDALTAEGMELLEDIRTEPESLVLASVTQSSDEVMLVIPQAGVLPAAETYLKCWQDGTAAQAFSLMSPHMIVEYDSDVGLPRENNALDALLDAPARELPVSDRLMPTFVLDNGAAVVVADTGGTHGYAQLPGDVEVAFVATDTNDRDDNPLIGGNIDDRSLDWSQGAADVDGRMSFGALTLIRYPGSGQWLVYDHWIELDPGTIE